MTIRRLVLILLSPFLLALAIVSVIIGSATFAGTDLARILAAAWAMPSAEIGEVTVLGMRVLLLPFQLIFMVIVSAVALWVIRRRGRLGDWILGDPPVEPRTTGGLDQFQALRLLEPGRRRTLRQIFSSIIVVLSLTVATVLNLGQFIDRADLAVVVAALTTSLTWGARLPIGDILGGISSIFESNLSIGDRIIYKQFDRIIDGEIESVSLRFLSVRALAGELTTIPFGELRIFRNYSRSAYIGVYATVPVAAGDLGRAVALLNEMAPDSANLVFNLLEPWQPMSIEGQLGAVVDLSVFGKARPGCEDELHLEMHELIQARFWEAGIPLAGQEVSAT